MTFKHHLLSIAACFAMLIPAHSFAQTSNEMLAQLSDDDMESLKSLVMYDGQTRENILEASTQPGALIKMEKIKDRTSDSFNQLIGSKDKTTQQALWDLTRYPGLIDALVATGPSAKGVDGTLKGFDEVIHKRAKEMHATEFGSLEQISTLNRESEAAFDGVMSRYPETTQKAMRSLLDHPEVLSIMTEKMDMTVTVGDMYRRDPKGTILVADSLNQVVEEENAQEQADWKKRLEDDPEALEEFKQSTEDFKNEQVQDDVYYDEQESTTTTTTTTTTTKSSPRQDEQVVHHYYSYNYPYWYSYPRWYSAPRWRPYPWYYDWGFSYGWGGGWSFGYGYWGMPSYYYMNWYYGNPYHHQHYPALTCGYMDHYYGHRNSLSSVSVSSQTWHGRNADVLPADLSEKNPNRVEAIREFGKMEADRQSFNRANPGKELDQASYLRTNNGKFNTLARENNITAPREVIGKDETSRFERPGNTTGRIDAEPASTERPVQTRPQTGNVERPTSSGTSSDKDRVSATDRREAPSPGGQPTRTNTKPQYERSNVTHPQPTRNDRAADRHRSGWSKPTPKPASRNVGGSSPSRSSGGTKPSGPSRPSGGSRSSGGGSSSPSNSRGR